MEYYSDEGFREAATWLATQARKFEEQAAQENDPDKKRAASEAAKKMREAYFWLHGV